MKTNVIEDLSKLTTINELTLQRLSDKVSWCIADSVEQSVLAGDSTSEIDIGIGTLTVMATGDEVRYRFQPNSKLNKAVTSTVITGKNPLTFNLESTLVQKICNTCKNFF